MPASRSAVSTRPHLGIDTGQLARRLEQHMIPDQGEGVHGRPIEAVPRVMKIQGRAVVDEPQPAMPYQHIDVADGAIHVAHEGIEPDHRRSQARIGHEDQGIESDGAGQIVQADIQAGARADEALYLRIGLGARELGRQFDKDDFRHRQARRPADLARQKLGDQGLGPLPGSAKFEHV